MEAVGIICAAVKRRDDGLEDYIVELDTATVSAVLNRVTEKGALGQERAAVLSAFLGSARTRGRALPVALELVSTETVVGSHAFTIVNETQVALLQEGSEGNDEIIMDTLRKVSESLPLTNDESARSANCMQGKLRLLDTLPTLVRASGMVKMAKPNASLCPDLVLRTILERPWCHLSAAPLLSVFAGISMNDNIGSLFQEKIGRFMTLIPDSDYVGVAKSIFALFEKDRNPAWLKAMKKIVNDIPMAVAPDLTCVTDISVARSPRVVAAMLESFDSVLNKPSHPAVDHNDVALTMLLYSSEELLPKVLQLATAQCLDAALTVEGEEDLVHLLCASPVMKNRGETLLALATFWVGTCNDPRHIARMMGVGHPVVKHNLAKLTLRLFHNIFKSFPEVRDALLSTVLTSILEEASEDMKDIFVSTLEIIMKTCVMYVVCHLPKLTNWLRYVQEVPESMAKRVLDCSVPIAQHNHAFKEELFILFRKLLHSPIQQCRRVAVHGLGRMLVSRVVVDPSAQCDMIASLRGCLKAPPAVRQETYRALEAAVKKNVIKPEPLRMIGDMLYERVLRYCDLTGSDGPILDFTLLFDSHRGSLYLREPMAELFRCLVAVLMQVSAHARAARGVADGSSAGGSSHHEPVDAWSGPVKKLLKYILHDCLNRNMLERLLFDNERAANIMSRKDKHAAVRYFDLPIPSSVSSLALSRCPLHKITLSDRVDILAPIVEVYTDLCVRVKSFDQEMLLMLEFSDLDDIDSSVVEGKSLMCPLYELIYALRKNMSTPETQGDGSKMKTGADGSGSQMPHLMTVPAARTTLEQFLSQVERKAETGMVVLPLSSLLASLQVIGAELSGFSQGEAAARIVEQGSGANNNEYESHKDIMCSLIRMVVALRYSKDNVSTLSLSAKVVNSVSQGFSEVLKRLTKGESPANRVNTACSAVLSCMNVLLESTGEKIRVPSEMISEVFVQSGPSDKSLLSYALENITSDVQCLHEDIETLNKEGQWKKRFLMTEDLPIVSQILEGEIACPSHLALLLLIELSRMFDQGITSKGLLSTMGSISMLLKMVPIPAPLDSVARRDFIVNCVLLLLCRYEIPNVGSFRTLSSFILQHSSQASREIAHSFAAALDYQNDVGRFIMAIQNLDKRLAQYSHLDGESVVLTSAARGLADAMKGRKALLHKGSVFTKILALVPKISSNTLSAGKFLHRTMEENTHCSVLNDDEDAVLTQNMEVLRAYLEVLRELRPWLKHARSMNEISLGKIPAMLKNVDVTNIALENLLMACRDFTNDSPAVQAKENKKINKKTGSNAPKKSKTTTAERPHYPEWLVSTADKIHRIVSEYCSAVDGEVGAGSKVELLDASRLVKRTGGKKRRLRSRNQWIDEGLGEVGGDDDYADLEDWIVPDDESV